MDHIEASMLSDDDSDQLLPQREPERDETLVEPSKTTEVDGVLNQIGEWGLFQTKQWLFLSYIWIPAACLALNMVFVSPTVVPWHCPANTMSECVNTTIYGPESCCNTTDIYLETSSVEKQAQSMERLCLLEPGSWEFTHRDHTVTAEFGFVCEDKWKAAFLGSAYFAGVGVGAVVFGPLSDTIGRKKTIWITFVGMQVFAIASAFCNDFGSYMVMRVLTGAFSSGLTLVAFVLCSEMIGKRYRATAQVATQAVFAVGEIFLAWTAYGVRPWRTQTLVIIAFATPTLINMFTSLCESPHWLISKGKLAQALENLQHIAATNSKPFPVNVDLRSSIPTNTDGEGDATRSKRSGCAACDREGSLRILFRHPTLRKRQLVMMLGWFTSSLVYYGFSIAGSSLSGDKYTDFTLQACAELPGLFLAKFAVDSPRFGRRGAAVLSFGVAALASLALMVTEIVSGDDESSTAIKETLSFLGKLGISASFAIVYIIPIELIPTPYRAASMGLCSVAARIGGVLAPQVALLQDIGTSLPYLAFAIPAILSTLLSLTLPETLGKPLPQTMRDIDRNYRSRQDVITAINEIELDNIKTH
eukprot:m.154651 g.154651  ORF g.154651 m.154651 type:complete len:588 (-) comp30901_c0_seq4:322-2085(-)